MGEGDKKMKEKILALLAFFALVTIVWQASNYLDKYALCETTNKQFEMMKQVQQEQMKYIEHKTNKMEQLFDLKFKTQELKSVEEQIYQIEKNFGTSPKDPIKRADLEKLRRDRERIMLEMKALEKK
jgi:hypothetical protein